MLSMKMYSINDLIIVCAISESNSPKTSEFNRTLSDSSLLSYGLTTDAQRCPVASSLADVKICVRGLLSVRTVTWVAVR